MFKKFILILTVLVTTIGLSLNISSESLLNIQSVYAEDEEEEDVWVEQGFEYYENIDRTTDAQIEKDELATVVAEDHNISSDSANYELGQKLTETEYNIVPANGYDAYIETNPNAVILETLADGSYIMTDWSENTGWYSNTKGNDVTTYVFGDAGADSVNVVLYNRAEVTTLVAKKNVRGNMGNKNEAFDFVLMLNVADPIAGNTYEWEIIDSTNGVTMDSGTIDLQADTYVYILNFSLTDDQYIKVNNLDIGDKYTVTETETPTGYITSVAGSDKSYTKSDTYSGTLGKSSENMVYFINKLDSPIATGLYTGSAVVMSVIILLGIILIGIFSRKKGR